MTDNKVPSIAVRAHLFLRALNVLTEKGVAEFLVREVVAEIDQRQSQPVGNPANYHRVVVECERAGVIQCLNPQQRRYRRWKVNNQRFLNTYLAQLDGDETEKNHALRAMNLHVSQHVQAGRQNIKHRREDLPPIELNTDEFTVVEPVHTNGRKKIGWFRRWFTNAEVVEELRETNSRLEKLLEVWE